MWGKETMKVVGLTETECSMMHVLTKRLGSISSPVVRSQLLLQMSQLIDIAFIGECYCSSVRGNCRVTHP